MARSTSVEHLSVVNMERGSLRAKSQEVPKLEVGASSFDKL